MKTTSKKTLILAIAAVVLLSGTLVFAEQSRGGRGKGDRERFKLTEERVEQILERIAEKDPAKAEELRKLQTENPEEFRQAIRDVRRKMYGRDGNGRGKDGKGPRKGDKGPSFGPMTAPGGSNCPMMLPGSPNCPLMGPDGLGKGGLPGMSHSMRGRGFPGGGGRENMREMHQDYIEWLEKNYPEDAKKLAKLRDDNPALHMRWLNTGMKQHRRIIEASKSNPALAEVLKADLELKNTRTKLAKKIQSTTDEKEAAKLKAELKEVVGNRFDLIVKRKQLRYDEMQKQLKKLEAEVQQRKGELDKLQNNKAKQVNERFEQLISKTENIDWN